MAAIVRTCDRFISRAVDTFESIPDIQTVLGKIYELLHPLPTGTRTIHYNPPVGIRLPKRIKTSNKVTTAKYNIITFLPKNLLEQFQRLANVYFLVVSCLQLFTPFSPTGRFGTAIPLVIVIICQMLKDIYEDIFRHRADWKTNNAKTYISRAGGEIKKVKWKHVRTGDLIRVNNDEYFPADIVCLGAKSKKIDREGKPRRDICYIETSQLDGETNLKIRRPINETKDYDEETYTKKHYKLEYEAPNHFVYKFSGKISVGDGPQLLSNSMSNNDLTKGDTTKDDAISHASKAESVEEISYPVGPDNVLLRGSALKNTEWIIGLVAYTGKHTKLRLNSKASPHKRSKIEKRINYYLFSIFLSQWIIVICSVIARAIWNSVSKDHWYIFTGFSENAFWTIMESIITFFILFNNFIPISLYVSMEMVKLLQAGWFMNKDIKMYYAPKDTPAEVKSSSLNEELGQVEFIFSDKTGTLTQNKMELLKFSVNGKIYGFFQEEVDDNNVHPEDWKVHEDGFQFWDNRISNSAWMTQPEKVLIQDLFFTLAACHDVIPERNDKNNPDKVDYVSSSPDDIALVKTMKHLGFEFIDRSSDQIILRINGKEVRFNILNILEFSSKRKRMSVIVKFPDTGRIFLLSKGADSEMMKRMKSSPVKNRGENNLDEILTSLAKDGLRTLVIGKAEIGQAEYDQWQKNHFYPASISNIDREILLEEAYEKVERNLTYVGVTAIEDKLQNGVPEAISTLTAAGIKIWVLTGDKRETALNIGKTCRMITDDMNMTIIDYTPSSPDVPLKVQVREVRQLVEDAYNKIINDSDGLKKPQGLLVTGATLDLIIPPKVSSKKKSENTLEEVNYKGEERLNIVFLRLCLLCRAVICCRVAPLQKAQIVLLVKENLKGSPTTLAIGDGANDVSMIQAAHIGVGISGEEGLQAAKAADYAIAQFEYLTRLLLVHGRWNYRRISKLICYSFYKNAIVQLCNFYFLFFNGFTGKSLYENTSLALFNVVWASIPIMVLALFDQDVKADVSLNHPQLYIDGPRDYHFNLRVFVFWLLNGLWHSLIIFFIPYGILQYGVMNDGKTPDHQFFGLLLFTAIIIVINFKILIESSNWTPLHLLSVLGSIFVWFIFVIIYGVIWWLVPKWGFLSEIEETLRGYYFTFFDAASTSLFWLILLLIVTLCLMRDVIWKSVRRTFPLTRKYYHIIQDHQRRNIKDRKTNYSVQAIKPRNRKIKMQPIPKVSKNVIEVELADDS